MSVLRRLCEAVRRPFALPREVDFGEITAEDLRAVDCIPAAELEQLERAMRYAFVRDPGTGEVSLTIFEHPHSATLDLSREAAVRLAAQLTGRVR